MESTSKEKSSFNTEYLSSSSTSSSSMESLTLKDNIDQNVIPVAPVDEDTSEQRDVRAISNTFLISRNCIVLSEKKAVEKFSEDIKEDYEETVSGDDLFDDSDMNNGLSKVSSCNTTPYEGFRQLLNVFNPDSSSTSTNMQSSDLLMSSSNSITDSASEKIDENSIHNCGTISQNSSIKQDERQRVSINSDNVPISESKVVEMEHESSGVSQNSKLESKSSPNHQSLVKSVISETSVCATPEPPIHQRVIENHLLTGSENASPKVPMDVTIAESTKNVKLPKETLTKIFKLLCLKDRKSVRLVCHAWYNGCNSYTIQWNEKIRIGSLENDLLDEVMATLIISPRRCFHFEFYKVNLKKKPRALFWRNCGPRVLSIRLTECLISDITLVSIVRHCFNLSTLQLDLATINVLEKGVKLDALDTAISSGQINKSVLCLEIRCRNDYMWAKGADINNLYWLRLLSQFLRLFPNIRSFSLIQRDLVKPNVARQPLMVNVETAAHTDFIYKVLVSNQMRNISLNFCYHPKLEWYALATIGLTKITEFAVDVRDNTNLLTLSKFIRSQTNMKKFVCRLSESLSNNLNQFNLEFLPLLMSHQTLEALKLSMPEDMMIFWRSNWFYFLCESKIKSFHIKCGAIFHSESTLEPHPPNCVMRDLLVRVNETHGVNMRPILQSFCNLEKLTVSHLTNDVLRLIGCNMQLRSLVVDNVSDVDVFSVNHRYRLNELEKLRVAFAPKISRHSMVWNPFMKLKYLYLDAPPCYGNFEYYRNIENCISLDTLRMYLTCPSLEGAWIGCCISPFFEDSFVQILVRFLAPLKRLRFLYLTYDVISDPCNLRLTEEDVQFVFSKCPSLEILIYHCGYFKDVIEKRVRKWNYTSKQDNEFLEKYLNIKERWE